MEFDEKAEPVIDMMLEQKALIKENRYGGTMRLGAYNCQLKPGTISRKAYGAEIISERHRHRYELNNKYKEILEKNGLVISGINPEKNLVEIVELSKNPSAGSGQGHPFFVATQFHPEFKSNPLEPHSLFREFIRSALKK